MAVWWRNDEAMRCQVDTSPKEGRKESRGENRSFFLSACRRSLASVREGGWVQQVLRRAGSGAEVLGVLGQRTSGGKEIRGPAVCREDGRTAWAAAGSSMMLEICSRFQRVFRRGMATREGRRHQGRVAAVLDVDRERWRAGNGRRFSRMVGWNRGGGWNFGGQQVGDCSGRLLTTWRGAKAPKGRACSPRTLTIGCCSPAATGGSAGGVGVQ